MRPALLVFILLCLNISNTEGQYSRLTYFMDIPQNRFLNPAMKPSDSLYIGLPFISGIGFSVDNNFLRYNDLFFKRNDSILSVNDPGFNPKKILSHISENNLVEADAFVQIFGLSFKAWKGFVLFDINDRIGIHGKVPRSSVNLAVIDPVEHIGEQYDFSDGNAGFYYFREIGLGYSWEQTPGIRAGIKIKFLAGMGSLYSGIEEWQVRLNETGYFTSSKIDANVSAPLEINYDNGGRIDEIDLKRKETIDKVLMQGGINPGLALDIGTTWIAGDRITLSASLTDIGFIRWRKENSTFRINDEFEFRSFNVIEPGGDNSVNAISDRFLDSIQNLVSVSVFHFPFTGRLPASLYAGAEYLLDPGVSIGLLSRTRFIAGNTKQSFTLSANLNRRNVSATVGYTVANRSFNNLGAGIAFRAGPFQLYLISDRIPVRWERINAGNGYSYAVPVQWNTFDIRAGLNLLFSGKGSGNECVFPYRKEINSGRH